MALARARTSKALSAPSRSTRFAEVLGVVGNRRHWRTCTKEARSALPDRRTGAELMRTLTEAFAPGAPSLPEGLRTLVVSPDRTVEPGTTIRATFAFYNFGGAAATGLRVRFSLPEGLRYIAGSARVDDRALDDVRGETSPAGGERGRRRRGPAGRRAAHRDRLRARPRRSRTAPVSTCKRRWSPTRRRSSAPTPCGWWRTARRCSTTPTRSPRSKRCGSPSRARRSSARPGCATAATPPPTTSWWCCRSRTSPATWPAARASTGARSPSTSAAATRSASATRPSRPPRWRPARPWWSSTGPGSTRRWTTTPASAWAARSPRAKAPSSSWPAPS